MKRITKIPIAIIMMLMIMTSSVLTAFAASDGVQGKSYSYTGKGDCTVDYGDAVWVSSNYTYTHKFYVNGKIATCCWSTNSTPSKGTYKNATKYYLSKSAMRAKAFYWLYLKNDTTIASANAKYKSSSKTYYDDINNALKDCGASGAYAFVHSVIDYLQQGELNPYCDDAWNRAVKAFAAKTEYYPNVPADTEIYYFYPSGNASQSLMSWEGAPHGYIKIVKSSSNTSITNGNPSYSFNGIEYYVSKSKTDFDTSGSNYLGYIKLNAAGEGHSKDGSRATLRNLYPGTYYVKEGYISSGCSYKKNDTVYTVTVTKDHTTTAPLVLKVSDTPKTCYGKIVKSSTKPEWTNGNPDYSFEGIRYSFSKSSSDFDPSGNNYIGYVELDKNGVGYTANGSRATLRNLVPGTYYVKESVIPAGCKYKMDKTVYKMTFTFSNDENNLKVMNVKDEPEGSSSAKIIKKSSMPEISDGNSMYSFEGAEFTVYKTKADAEQGINAFTTVVTDENGVSSISEIDLGTYYVKETKAPYGFELSDEIKELKIEALQEEAYVVEFEDKPIITPLSVLLQKRASNGSEGRGIDGAEYTVNYYNGKYDSVDELAGVSPTRSWVFETDTYGNIAYTYDYRKSGDDLYYDETTDTYGLPLGTVTMQETKAPKDFYLDEQVYLSQITLDAASDTVLYNYPVSEEESIEYVTVSGVKTWDDDNNRDGKRPKSVTVELYRDNELFDSCAMSEETSWQYEFANLEKGYADIDIENHFHEYQYDVKEGAVEYYESSTGGTAADPEDENHLICDFLNHYVPAKTNVSGTKTWKDFENVMGYRPEKIIVAIFMITALAIPMASAAASGNALDTSKKVSITMNCDKAGYEFEVFKIADLVTATNPYTVKYDVKVTDAAVKAAVSDGNFEEADRGKILTALDKDSKLTGATSVGKYNVDYDGASKTLSDLAQGIYYVRAVNFPAGVKAVTNSCFALPYYAENGWTFTLDAINLAEKVEDEHPEIHKIITNSTRGNENFSDVSIGDTVEFQITTSVLGVVDEIPEHEFKLNSYVITDLMSKGLTLNQNSFAVKLVDAENKELAKLDPKDYTVSVTAEEGKDTNFTVSLNKEYLQKDDFYAAENVVTTYSAVLNKYATTTITGNPNEAVELKYTNKNDVEGTVEGNTVYVYTFKVQVNKVDEQGNPLSGADFSVYKTEADAKDEKNALASGTSDNNGVVVFLNADNAEMLLESGTYYVKETKAPSGFNKYTDVIPVEIKVTYGDTLTNGTYILSGPKLGLTSIDVKNSKTVLPQTGGQGNIIAYSIAFILLVAGGTVFFISRRKKKSEDKAA